MTAFPELSVAVDDWDVIVIGHLRWNRYFGETAAKPPRGQPSTCTCVLVRGRTAEGAPYRLLIDPTWRDTASEFYFDLNRRTGLHAREITHGYATHEHADHQIGLGYFAQAEWLAAPPVADALRGSEHIPGERVRAVVGEFLPGVAPLALPGHTLTLHGLAFRHAGRRIVVAGDAVMTRHHYQHETTEFERDAALAAETIRWLKTNADIVVPGHDNLILNAP